MKTKLIQLTLIFLLATCYSLSVPGKTKTPDRTPENDLKKTALGILETKCNACHRVRNPRKVFTKDNIEILAERIYKQVFVKRRMPQGDTKLTTLEEQTLMRWLETQHTRQE